MRTVKIERERWRTPTNGHGPKKLLLNRAGHGCIMGMIGLACGIKSEGMVDASAFGFQTLEKLGIECDLQERAIEINDNESLDDCEREAKLKELFKDHLILEFV